MTDTNVGFLGGGRITRIFLGGWAHAGCMPDHVVVCDIDEKTLGAIRQKYPDVQCVIDDPSALANLQFVFLAVHPPAVAQAVAGIKDSLDSSTILVSLVPKFTIDQLSELSGGFDQIVRVIPNAASIVGQGYNPLAYSRAVSGPQRASLRSLLEQLGECPETQEDQLAGYAVITAMGPTYLWPHMFELTRLAEQFGMTKDEAVRAVKQMVYGTIATMTESGLDAQAVEDLIPVKPLADIETQAVEAYDAKLTALWNKLR